MASGQECKPVQGVFHFLLNSLITGGLTGGQGFFGAGAQFPKAVKGEQKTDIEVACRLSDGEIKTPALFCQDKAGLGLNGPLILKVFFNGVIGG